MPFAANAHSRPDYDYPVETWLADLDAHGIGRGVIAAASLFDDDNAYTLAALAAHPRLRATILAGPRTGAVARFPAPARRQRAACRIAGRECPAAGAAAGTHDLRTGAG
eukprot:gene8791-11890_t